MFSMPSIRNALAAVAVLSAALALGGASAASAATHAPQTEPINLYLYVGNGNLVPQVEPTQIYTADGTIIDEQGKPLPAPYGAAGRSTPAGPGVLPRPPPAWAGPASTGARSYRTSSARAGPRCPHPTPAATTSSA
jgi:hypothetical protein